MIKAVIFDMDGLMIDSERLTFEGFQVVLDKIGLSIGEDIYVSTLGKTPPHARAILIDFFGEDFDLDSTIDDVHQYLWDTFEEKGVPLKKGLLDLLTYLKDNQYMTIVATSSVRDRVDRILDLSHLTSYFNDSICGDEVKIGKPNPEVFLNACEKLGVQPHEALVLEDSEAGIEAAYNAHIPVICVPDMKYPEQHYQGMTTQIVDSLEDVIPFLKKHS